MSGPLSIAPLEGIGEIRAGDRVGDVVAAALETSGYDARDGDVIVVSQKIVSKAEGRVRALAEVSPGEEARTLAAQVGKDPRMVELILAESRAVIRASEGVLITETNGGWICANAGIDSSNVAAGDAVALLPLDADASARRIRAELAKSTGARPAIVIADSFGRPWRMGQSDVCIGCAGIVALDDWRGRSDAHGHTLTATVIAAGDELAAAADLARDKASQTPAVLIRGADRWWTADDGPGAAARLQRPLEDDLFR